jgi:hypothetical protein
LALRWASVHTTLIAVPVTDSKLLAIDVQARAVVGSIAWPNSTGDLGRVKEDISISPDGRFVYAVHTPVTVPGPKYLSKVDAVAWKEDLRQASRRLAQRGPEYPYTRYLSDFLIRSVAVPAARRSCA